MSHESDKESLRAFSYMAVACAISLAGNFLLMVQDSEKESDIRELTDELLIAHHYTHKQIEQIKERDSVTDNRKMLIWGLGVSTACASILAGTLLMKSRE